MENSKIYVDSKLIKDTLTTKSQGKNQGNKNKC